MNLKAIRLESGLTQEQVAKLTDVTIRYISELESGRKNPSDKTKIKLAKAYHKEPVDIFLACQRTKCSKTKKKGEQNGQTINH